jgi:hypothetical protein
MPGYDESKAREPQHVGSDRCPECGGDPTGTPCCDAEAARGRTSTQAAIAVGRAILNLQVVADLILARFDAEIEEKGADVIFPGRAATEDLRGALADMPPGGSLVRLDNLVNDVEEIIADYYFGEYDGPPGPADDKGGNGIDPKIDRLMDAWADAKGIVTFVERWEAVEAMIDRRMKG